MDDSDQPLSPSHYRLQGAPRYMIPPPMLPEDIINRELPRTRNHCSAEELAFLQFQHRQISSWRQVINSCCYYWGSLLNNPQEYRLATPEGVVQMMQAYIRTYNVVTVDEHSKVIRVSLPERYYPSRWKGEEGKFTWATIKDGQWNYRLALRTVRNEKVPRCVSGVGGKGS
ncbi:uncharacterized protein BT62DRAFT_920583 [Guyanagaster necrorhizus]|uniref:Uncharacterized protein n=1 Tax=Guyanagaster necrorhizus TaxID=856835 RepID=A0A9P7VQ38_9AGAR|nr:uncharacterized protein BT62DRAFT_920583 [Guyanagaster necrorhizus MCA 3950]KAG7445336.1 hypothetical protein BT62DRAFT_920583 [Guyanagaster necrorhizus MCA 3950]